MIYELTCEISHYPSSFCLPCVRKTVDAAAAANANIGVLADAIRRNAKNVIYADFKPKEDFSLWLAGYREKIRNAFGLDHTQEIEVNNEVVRSISGKLQCGTALDAYKRLPIADKNDYDHLVERLTGEFVDPQEQQRYLEDFAYNKRIKGAIIKGVYAGD